ncbi:hypothetical protein D3C87_1616460 [compost metagenome]
MNQLDQSSQSNAASAEEIAATSGEISNLATATQQLTVDLNLAVLGGDGENIPAPRVETEKAASFKKSPSAVSSKVAPKAKVIPMKKPSSMMTAKSDSAAAIPFDDDEPRAKVGTTDGF